MGREEKSLRLKAKNQTTVWTFLIFFFFLGGGFEKEYKGVHTVEVQSVHV